MKQVLIDMHVLKRDEYTGLYQFSYNLGKALASRKKLDFNLVFYTPKNKIGCFGNNVDYRIHKSIDKFFMPNTKQYHVWHITNQNSWYKPFNNQTKIIYTIHDLNFLNEEDKSETQNTKQLNLIQQRINMSHHIVCISNFVKEQVQQFLNIVDKPISVIYNGVNEVTNSIEMVSSYKPQKPFLFCLGTLHKRKNYATLSCLLQNNEYELLIAGDNNFGYDIEILKAAKQFGVEDRVKIVGGVSENDKNWYLKNCYAFLFPSIAEGFGIPIIEAMQFGKPVFLSTKTSLPEIGGDAAYFFDSFEPNKMIEVFNNGMNDYTRNKLQQKIIERANLFTWGKAANAYLKLYESI